MAPVEYCTSNTKLRFNQKYLLWTECFVESMNGFQSFNHIMTAIQLTIPLQKGRYTVVEAPSCYWKIKSKEGFQDTDSLTTDHLRIILAVPRKHPVRSQLTCE